MKLLDRGPSGGWWQPPPAPPPLDPAAASGWLGIRFAALKTPTYQVRYLAQHFSDSAFGRTPDGRDAPVSITIRHHFDDRYIDVMTRRLYHDSDSDDHMWSALTEYRLADPPDVDDLAGWARQYTLRLPPAAEDGHAILVDGASVPCRRMSADDLVVLGTGIPGGIVAVVCPADDSVACTLELLPAP